MTSVSQPSPDPPSLAFVDFLAFFGFPISLAFLCVFPFFSKDFRGSATRETLVFFGVSLAFFQKSKGPWVLVAILGQCSTPSMTGRRFHRTMEVIPRRPWKSKSPFASRPITICPDTITEIIRFRFLRCKNYVTAPEINSPRGPKLPGITVQKSLKSPVRIAAPKNNSKTISVM